MGTQLTCSQDTKESATAISTACPHPQSQTVQDGNENSYGYKHLTQRLHQRKYRVGTMIWLSVDDKTLPQCCVCTGGAFPLVPGLFRVPSVHSEIHGAASEQTLPKQQQQPRAWAVHGTCGDLVWVPRAGRAPHAPQRQQHTEHPQLSQAALLLLCTGHLSSKAKK